MILKQRIYFMEYTCLMFNTQFETTDVQFGIIYVQFRMIDIQLRVANLLSY